jgi:uncharacterized protein (TIGR03663 family)
MFSRLTTSGLWNRRFFAGLFLAFAIALAFRCPELGLRPMHGDEAVHAMKFGELWEKGAYQYDPNEYHGPSLYYLTYGISKVSAAPSFERFSEARLRVVPVVFGVGLVLLAFLVSDGLGRGATVWAGVLTALSPAMVFYSRYYIHEILLVFFAFLIIVAGWRYWKSGRVAWAVLAGAGMGLMHATKETFVFSVAAGCAALALTKVWGDRMGEPPSSRKTPWSHWAAALAAWAVVAVVLFSSFFTHWSGVGDSLKTYIPWFDRAAGASPHGHEWWFYLKRLAWFHEAKGPVFSEMLILGLSLIGLHCAITGKGVGDGHRGFVRFLGFYTAILTVIYCAIDYKTPWCLLSFWQGMILLAGVGAATLWRRAKGRRWTRYAFVVLLGAGLAHLGVESALVNGEFSSARQNPYVYAHTSEGVLELTSMVEGIVAASSNDTNIVVQVAAPEHDYWPLPWYFRNFKQVGFYDALPRSFPPEKSIVILSTRFQDTEPLFQDSRVNVGIQELRPGVFLQLYISKDIWDH